MGAATNQLGDCELIGDGPAMTHLKKELARVARSDAKVLITGESGTGKEIVARAITRASRRAHLPFVPVNCAGIPETLLESELFGYVKGSFTGAYRDKPGKLAIAENGTVFLDEIGEMTLRMQGLLLRFLETGEIQRVGAERTAVVANVRVIAATNRNLRHMIEQGQFRADLFYRLDVIHITLPPLRQRREDIPLLIHHFLARFGAGDGNGRAVAAGPSAETSPTEGGPSVTGISPDAVAALCRYHWPGNVRELENAIERFVVAARRETIGLDDLEPEFRTPLARPGTPQHERRRTIADDLFNRMLTEGESFWTTVYRLYLDHEITRANVRDIVHKGLTESRGSYKVLLRLFNVDPGDYKRFMNFLHNHHCQLPFKDYR